MTIPKFVFMLTRNDRTLTDAHTRLDAAIAAGVRNIGFKDVGLSAPALQELTTAIRSCGARVYLEVVSLDATSELASARAAVSLQVDCLLGGTRPKVVLPVIRGSGIGYFPFPGSIVGHPSRLLGSVEDIVASAKMLAETDGVDGLDLLAYRFRGDAPTLIAQVCRHVAPKPVIVAGSIDRDERLGAVVRGGAAAFTVGTAALDGAFPAATGRLADQLRYIQMTLCRIAQECAPTDRTAAHADVGRSTAGAITTNPPRRS
jgi:4-hydroxythreonine-4-phosphate dehydrogenase